MKVGYHFLSEHPGLGSGYGYQITREVLRKILDQPAINMRTKVFTGDLLLSQYAREREVIRTGHIERFSQEKYAYIFNKWLDPESPVWSTLPLETREATYGKFLYVMCFETLDQDSAQSLHNRLEGIPYYLGAMEVDDSSRVHWALYSASLIPKYRLQDGSARVFWDGITEDSKDEEFLAFVQECGFTPVTFESLNGRYTIFDKYEDFEHARRIAIWKRRSGNLLAFIADDVVSRLSDIAPELGDKLYAAMKTFDAAETNEELAQVMTSCRRIFQYVTDRIFPSVEESDTGRDLSGKKYRNRILAYADEAHRSDTNIDLVAVSTDIWSSQVEKLSNLASKGVHAEVYRAEARRTLLRTILLLEDIVSLRTTPFEIKGHVDTSSMIEWLKRIHTE